MEQIFLAPSKYGADLVKEWLLEEDIESKIVFETDPNNDPERRTAGKYAVFCHSKDYNAAARILGRIGLWVEPVGLDERIALLPELDDEDLLNTFVEEFHRNPSVSIAAEMELDRRGKKPSQSMVDRLFHKIREHQEWEDTPVKESIRHYLAVLLIPVWGFILGSMVLVSPNHPKYSNKRWFKNAKVHGAVTCIFGSLIWLMFAITVIAIGLMRSA